ncbi:hypothetical protein [Burkholderia sp. S-53]|uniref:hypothetical protein n=1 Tax=Burkholderia sp. S-53 TaxID=2906514 RepID=UPI0021CFFC86|nr:hypothetical protein [Burkholderia sp. S-53]UXU90125.1 hypothetical protein LXM88_32965 [Burkholderia sp. S-53]
MGHPIARLAIATQQENRLHAIEAMRDIRAMQEAGFSRGARRACATRQAADVAAMESAMWRGGLSR